MNLNPKILAAGAGAMFGIIAVAFGFWPAVLVAALTGIGWIIGKWITGELGIIDEYIGRFFDNRRNR
jgi:uncharacterized membrane protein